MAKKRPTAFCATEGENIYVKVMKIIEMIRLNTESMKAKIATSKAGTNTVPLYVPFRCRMNSSSQGYIESVITMMLILRVNQLTELSINSLFPFVVRLNCPLNWPYGKESKYIEWEHRIHPGKCALRSPINTYRCKAVLLAPVNAAGGQHKRLIESHMLRLRAVWRKSSPDSGWAEYALHLWLISK